MYNLIIVDDEVRSIDALENNVNWRKCGVRNVHKAMCMEEAIDQIKKNKIDILVCDIEMPNGSGLNLLEWLRTEGYKISCIFITCHPEFDYMRKAIQLKCYDYILKPIHYSDFEEILNELVKKMEAYDSGASEEFSINWRGISDQEIKELANKEKDRNVELEVKKYIREHLKEDINIKEVAEELHFNPHYLMRQFKSKTGMSIMEYTGKMRMENAKKLLRETQLPIKDVANLVGYSDYAYFTRVFRKELGISPTQFRNT